MRAKAGRGTKRKRESKLQWRLMPAHAKNWRGKGKKYKNKLGTVFWTGKCQCVTRLKNLPNEAKKKVDIHTQKYQDIFASHNEDSHKKTFRLFSFSHFQFPKNSPRNGERRETEGGREEKKGISRGELEDCGTVEGREGREIYVQIYFSSTSFEKRGGRKES